PMGCTHTTDNIDPPTRQTLAGLATAERQGGHRREALRVGFMSLNDRMESNRHLPAGSDQAPIDENRTDRFDLC
ncbi:hypothetical protein, partial [Mesorhizobium sp. M4A.F.Ca.ET.050.02.1.1]|uniref:hypothetical protein n=1 Tax=Mesorhizobium sp. M4A.F.Ca.ET.050.02.1.1 TaxID=2496754 RepID=UPI001AECF4F7